MLAASTETRTQEHSWMSLLYGYLMQLSQRSNYSASEILSSITGCSLTAEQLREPFKLDENNNPAKGAPQELIVWTKHGIIASIPQPAPTRFVLIGRAEKHKEGSTVLQKGYIDWLFQ